MARIAFLIPNLGGGGAERVALTLTGAFVERGHEVDLLVMQRQGELLDLVPSGVRLIELAAPRTRDVFWPLIRYLRERRPDALQVSMWPLTIIGILAARLSRVPVRVVVSDHISLSRQYGTSKAALRWLKLTTRILYPLADRRICVSAGAARDLAQLSGISPERITTVYNPVPPLQPGKSQAEAEHRWGTAKVRLLTVGALKEQKNHALLIRSFATVADRHDAKLLIVGEGELRPALQQLIDELQLHDRVTLVGFVPDPAPFYATADLFVLASDYEGFALVLVEALHAGLKIVSTDCPDGPAEILSRGKFGRLVPVGNSQAMAAAIESELAAAINPEEQRARGAEFSVEAAAEAYLRLLVPGTLTGATTAAKRLPS